MHNGVFKSLKEVVYFYNIRDISDAWGASEVPRNVQERFMGDLGLTDTEVNAIVAFMKTLSDGYKVDGHGVGKHKHGDDHKKHAKKDKHDYDKKHAKKDKHDNKHA